MISAFVIGVNVISLASVLFLRVGPSLSSSPFSFFSSLVLCKEKLFPGCLNQPQLGSVALTALKNTEFVQLSVIDKRSASFGSEDNIHVFQQIIHQTNRSLFMGPLCHSAWQSLRKQNIRGGEGAALFSDLYL
eukprot:TRINITY_DN1668_c0_g5_i1.p1 TRINITY_DN1668_c0_g5~~TRINITY_DN1668_c0_g5_i1.p1  ORF type:complete len:133 (+),score=0.26 TRINITY_DN1668_c0_g5_i1:134-532(+)